jgi:hypothetical protein
MTVDHCTCVASALPETAARSFPRGQLQRFASQRMKRYILMVTTTQLSDVVAKHNERTYQNTQLISNAPVGLCLRCCVEEGVLK